MNHRFSVRKTFSAALMLVIFLLISCGPGPSKPSVILIIIDTLRADHLSCYGYSRNTSPVIDSLADSGILMENVFAQASWTLPATATIMSGLSTVSHGAGMDVPTGNVYGMDPMMPLLAPLLDEHGYRTAGFFNVYLLGGDFGFHRGFDTFMCRENGDGMAAETVDSALEWLGSIPEGDPFFLAVHLFDVHDPYDPPAPYDTYYTSRGSRGEVFWEMTPEGAVARPEQLDHLKGLYDGEIAFVDSQLGRLFAGVRGMDRESRPLVILTADHGEEFLEHGYVGHGRTLYPEITHVPLIISGPGAEQGVRRSLLCGQVDILPTVLDYCAIPPPSGVEGVSLLSGGAETERVLPSSGINTGHDFNSVAVRRGWNLLIWNPETDSTETYDLREDPLALRPVSCDSQLLEEALYYRSTPSSWDAVMLEKWKVAPVLRDLGYIN